MALLNEDNQISIAFDALLRLVKGSRGWATKREFEAGRRVTFGKIGESSGAARDGRS